jgi:hypothetical protein
MKASRSWLLIPSHNLSQQINLRISSGVSSGCLGVYVPPGQVAGEVDWRWISDREQNKPPTPSHPRLTSTYSQCDPELATLSRFNHTFLFLHTRRSAFWSLQFNNLNIQSVPHRKHYVSATEPNRLMLLRETVAVYCENHTEHTDTLCGQTAEVFNVKPGGIYSNHCDLNDYTRMSM